MERELRLVSSWREVLCLISLMTADNATSTLWMASLVILAGFVQGKQ